MQLKLVESRAMVNRLDRLAVCSSFNNATRVHDDNSLVVVNGGEPARDYNWHARTDQVRSQLGKIKFCQSAYLLLQAAIG